LTVSRRNRPGKSRENAVTIVPVSLPERLLADDQQAAPCL